MAISVVWFLDINCVYMSLIAAAFATGIHSIAAVVAVVRIGRLEGIPLILFVAVYTFISCMFYTIILAISVSYTYLFAGLDLDEAYVLWGLGFGILYVIIKVITAGYLK
jgi:hypothetical protein